MSDSTTTTPPQDQDQIVLTNKARWEELFRKEGEYQKEFARVPRVIPNRPDISAFEGTDEHVHWPESGACRIYCMNERCLTHDWSAYPIHQTFIFTLGKSYHTHLDYDMSLIYDCTNPSCKNLIK